MMMKIRYACAGALFGGLVGAFMACSLGCANQQQTANVVKGSVTLANDACVVVHALEPNSKAVSDVCVAENEIAPLVPQILAGRAAAAKAAVSADGSTR